MGSGKFGWSPIDSPVQQSEDNFINRDEKTKGTGAKDKDD